VTKKELLELIEKATEGADDNIKVAFYYDYVGRKYLEPIEYNKYGDATFKSGNTVYIQLDIDRDE
jgi:hypothetical protein